MTQVATNAVETAVEHLKKMTGEVPSAAVVLGSGVSVLENLPESQSVPYKDLFGIAPGVAGHAGSLSLGRVDGKLVAVLRGRFHLYEGHGWDVVTLATRVITAWGVPSLYLTNAAGGLNGKFRVGDLMILTGYLDFLNPKRRETGLLPAFREGIVDCRNELTKHLQAVSDKLADSDKAFRPLQSGTYAALLGPNYETLSEVDMLRNVGSDSVGMSTVPELQTALGTTTKAAAISVITNVWSPDVAIGGHEEVLEAAKEASQRLDKLFRTAIATA